MWCAKCAAFCVDLRRLCLSGGGVAHDVANKHLNVAVEAVEPAVEPIHSPLESVHSSFKGVEPPPHGLELALKLSEAARHERDDHTDQGPGEGYDRSHQGPCLRRVHAGAGYSPINAPETRRHARIPPESAPVRSRHAALAPAPGPPDTSR
jgi:hypothetical protein